MALTRRLFLAASAAFIAVRGSSDMVAILPDNQGSLYADLERRIRDLENTSRVGLSRVTQVLSNFTPLASNIGAPPALVGSSITVTTGRSVLVMIHGLTQGLGETADHYASGAQFGGQITPVPTTGAAGPIPLSVAHAYATPEIPQSGNMHRFTTPWIPGTYTFEPTIYFTANPFAVGPTILPTGWTQVIILPLD